jgi:sulfite oxidase
MIWASGILLTGLKQARSLGQDTASSTAAAEPSADKDLIFWETEPNNAEPELEKLIQSWITPTKYFYVRSHAPNPTIDANSYRLSVQGLVDKPLSLSLSDIKELKEHTLTATLTCAGNRRAEYNDEGEVGGVQWQAGAIGNATWTGVALADVLKMAGVKESARHVWFEGLDRIERDDGVIPFGASIPIDKALGSDGDIGALLSYAMNGQPLTADHGFPLRTLVPGYIGARSVKWVGKIVVSDRTSPNHYLATAYKLVRETKDIDWAEAGPIYRYLINAAIGSHAAGAKLRPGDVSVAGYVLPTGLAGAEVQSVALSTDGGVTWQEAELTGRNQAFCWQLWKANVQVTADTREIIVRASDTRGGFMPPRVPWNAKGYLRNSWFRLPVEVS